MNKETVKRAAVDLASAVVGSMLVGAGVALFTAPNDIAPGGVSGLATAISALLRGRVSIGVLSFLFNIPIVVLALRRLGWRPLATTVAATVLLSVFIDLFGAISPGYTGNALMAAVAGGVLTGAGTGVLFLRSASTGGTDLLSLALKSYFPNMEISKLLLLADAAVVLVAVLIFRNVEVALYSVVSIYVCSKVVDAIMQGVDYAKIVYVVTENGEPITTQLLSKIERGVTVVPAKGGYTGRDKQLLMVVTGRNELAQTLRIIKMTDPQSFVFVSSATEVHGEGFKTD